MLAQDKLKTYSSLILLAAALWLIHGFMSALLWAVVIAIATWPLRVRVASSTRFNNFGVAIVMTFVIAVLLLFPIVYALILVAQDLGGLTNLLMEVQKSGIPVPDWIHLIPKVGDQIVKWWSTNLTDSIGLTTFLGTLNNEWVKEFARNLGTQAAHRLVTLVFTILTLFFLYKQGEDLSRKTLLLLERLTGESGNRYGLQAASAIRAAVNGVVLVGLAEGFFIGLSYWIADAPHAAILGLATAALALIPFAAPLIFSAVSAFLLIQGNTVAAISVFAFGVLVLAVGDHVVRPKIIGSSVKLPFIWVLFGILGGVEVFGLIGLFIGPALMALVMMMWSDLTEPGSTVQSL